MKNLTQDGHYFILAHLCFCVSSNDWYWCEKRGKRKPCGYLHSKLDVTNLYLCSQTQGNLQGQGIFLALNSYLCGPEHINQKLKNRDVIVSCMLVLSSIHPLVLTLYLTRGTLAVTFPAAHWSAWYQWVPDKVCYWAVYDKPISNSNNYCNLSNSFPYQLTF